MCWLIRIIGQRDFVLVIVVVYDFENNSGENNYIKNKDKGHIMVVIFSVVYFFIFIVITLERYYARFMKVCFQL